MMKIDGEIVTDRFDIWSVEYATKDGPQEVIFTDGELAAREGLDYASGTLYVRKAYGTAVKPLAHVEDRVQVSATTPLN